MRVVRIGVGTSGRNWARPVRDRDGIELATVVDPAAAAVAVEAG